MNKNSETGTGPVGKRARTRAALVEAAGQLIAEEGYDRLSMDKVAARAGMTKGAIYGNFSSKEDLILAAFWAGLPPRPPPALVPGAAVADQLQAIANDLIAQAPHTRRVATQLVAFQLYALTHDEMRRRVVKENGAMYERMEAWVRRMLPVEGLPLSPAQFVRVLHIVSNGLLVAHAIAPENFDEDLVRAVFRALGGGTTRPTPHEAHGRGQTAVRQAAKRRKAPRRRALKRT